MSCIVIYMIGDNITSDIGSITLEEIDLRNMQKPGLIIGQKGVKYGLITRKDDKKPAKAPAGKLAAFGGDSDSDEDNIEAQVARQAARKVADSKVQDMYASALAEDPNAFEYDSLYDSMQEQKAVPKQQERLARRPKYIASLLEQAEVRKKEQGITYERMLLKERLKEDHMYDNTEKFITSAYRRKLEEDKKWQESQKLKELEEEQNDVTKLGHMNNFYTNLTKNIAMGGDTAAAPKGKAQTAAVAAAGAEAGAAGHSSPPPPAAAADRSQSPSSDDDQDEQQGAEREQQGAEREQQQRHVDDVQQQQQQQQPEQDHRRHRHDSPAAADRQAAAAAAAQQPGSRAAENKQQQSSKQGQPQQPEQQQQLAAAAAAAVAGKRKNTEDAIAAARERYLARKRQQQG